MRAIIDYGSISGGGGIDVSDTTALVEDVLEGKVFHLANGESAVGTLQESVVLKDEASGTASFNSSVFKTFTIAESGDYVFEYEYTTSGNYIQSVIHRVDRKLSGESASTMTDRVSGSGVGISSAKGIVSARLNANNTMGFGVQTMGNSYSGSYNVKMYKITIPT